jgi:hypothetical protein
MKCNNCQAIVPANQINISTDLAHCKACNTIFKISEITASGNPLFDIKKKPKGTWYKRIDSSQLNVGASTASPIAFFLIPFMLVWSGGSLGGIYGTQIISGKFDLFMSLFGIPFLIGSVFFGGIAFMSVAGKIDINLTKQGGTIFTGIGTIGFTKKFLWTDISNIEEQSFIGYKRRNSGSKIVMSGSRKISFGSRLKESRKYYLLNALKQVHYNLKNNNTLSF